MFFHGSGVFALQTSVSCGRGFRGEKRLYIEDRNEKDFDFDCGSNEFSSSGFRK